MSSRSLTITLPRGLIGDESAGIYMYIEWQAMLHRSIRLVLPG
jgi:hypothetical protein